jgi:hypothetical protein
LKLRTGATDSSTDYYYGITGLTAGNAAQNNVGNAVASGFFVLSSDNGLNGDFYASDITLYKPFLAVRTNLTITGSTWNTSSTFYGFSGGGHHGIGTSYDTANIIASAGNISGKVFVYGFNL